MAEDMDQRTPLHLACIVGDLALVKRMVSNGSSLDVKDRWGNEPLKYAMLHGYVDVIQFLEQATLSRESTVDLECKYYRSAAEGNMAAVRMLLQSKVSIDAVDYDRRSALHLAATHGKTDIVYFLLASGVASETLDMWGRTAMDCAQQAGRHELCHEMRWRTAQQSASHKRPRETDDTSYPRGALIHRWASMGDLMASNSAGRARKLENRAATWGPCAPCRNTGDQWELAGLDSWGRQYLDADDISVFSRGCDTSAKATAAAGRHSEISAHAGACSGVSCPSHTRRACHTSSIGSSGAQSMAGGSFQHLVIEDWAEPAGLPDSESLLDPPAEPSRGPGGRNEAGAWPPAAADEMEAIRSALGSASLHAARKQAEDAHLALVQHIFAHGADIAGRTAQRGVAAGGGTRAVDGARRSDSMVSAALARRPRPDPFGAGPAGPRKSQPVQGLRRTAPAADGGSGAGQVVQAREAREATVLFINIKGFTAGCARMTAQQVPRPPPSPLRRRGRRRRPRLAHGPRARGS
jgi:hypothetical protein